MQPLSDLQQSEKGGAGINMCPLLSSHSKMRVCFLLVRYNRKAEDKDALQDKGRREGVVYGYVDAGG